MDSALQHRDRDLKTLILTKKDIKKVLTPSATIKAVQKAFKAYGLGQAYMPPKSYVYLNKGDMIGFALCVNRRLV